MATELDWTLDEEAPDGERLLSIVLPKRQARQGAQQGGDGAIFKSLRVCGEEATVAGLVVGE